MSNFVNIGNLIKASLRRTGATKQVEAVQILDKFNNLCLKKWGEKAKGRVQAVYVRDKVLAVTCLNSVIAQEIQLNSHLFIKEINKDFTDSVERIKFLS